MFAVTHPDYIREKARSLRISKRLTIDEIAERLALPRTTIFHWVRDLPVSRSSFDPSRAAAARRRAIESTRTKHRLLREAAYNEGRHVFDALSRDPTFRDFVCLYLAEGYKRNRNRVSICNSDPAVVMLGARWINQLSARKVIYSVQYHEDQDLRTLQRFWSALLRIDPDRVLLQRKSNSKRLTGRHWRSQHGVLAVTTSDTYFRARLQAWMDLVRSSWA